MPGCQGRASVIGSRYSLPRCNIGPVANLYQAMAKKVLYVYARQLILLIL